MKCRFSRERNAVKSGRVFIRGETSNVPGRQLRRALGASSFGYREKSGPFDTAGKCMVKEAVVFGTRKDIV